MPTSLPFAVTGLVPSCRAAPLPGPEKKSYCIFTRLTWRQSPIAGTDWVDQFQGVPPSIPRPVLADRLCRWGTAVPSFSHLVRVVRANWGRIYITWTHRLQFPPASPILRVSASIICWNRCGGCSPLPVGQLTDVPRPSSAPRVGKRASNLEIFFSLLETSLARLHTDPPRRRLQGIV